jgi:hypothetical protein
VDRLIAEGLAPVGTRGQARLYGLADARRLLARRRAQADPAAEQAKRQDYLSHAEDLDDRRQQLEREWIATSNWLPLWRRAVLFVERFTRAWPRRLAERLAATTREELPRLLASDGPRPAPPPPRRYLATDEVRALLADPAAWPASWRDSVTAAAATIDRLVVARRLGLELLEDGSWSEWDPAAGTPVLPPPPVPPVMRPLLERLASAVEKDPAHQTLFTALAPPRPAAAPSAPTTTAAGRARWRETRAAYRAARVAVRRGHDRRADVHARIRAAIEESRLAWERWPGYFLLAAGDSTAALAAGHRLREEALAPLRRLAGAEEVVAR